MNTPHHDPATFDARMRQSHTAALSSLTPQTLAQLRRARQTAPRHAHRGRWLAVTSGCSALLAISAGLYLAQPATTPPADSGTVASAVLAGTDSDDLLDHNPELYVWLASETALAMEPPR